MLFEWKIIPIAFAATSSSQKLLNLLVTGNTFYLLLGQQRFFLVLLFFWDNQYDFFYFRLKEEECFFNFKLIAFKDNLIAHVLHSLQCGLNELLMIGTICFILQFCPHVFEVGEHLSLKHFQLLIKFRRLGFFQHFQDMWNLFILLL